MGCVWRVKYESSYDLVGASGHVLPPSGWAMRRDWLLKCFPPVPYVQSEARKATLMRWVVRQCHYSLNHLSMKGDNIFGQSLKELVKTMTKKQIGTPTPVKTWKRRCKCSNVLKGCCIKADQTFEWVLHNYYTNWMILGTYYTPKIFPHNTEAHSFDIQMQYI